MPQLMPLMWVCSMVISLILLMSLVEIYYYKEKYNFSYGDGVMNFNLVSFKW